ncbi:MAG: iron-sulfur cluster assembly scaffold protein [Caulobacterales bacterium]|nr:iron-sulfur cluster assembly scaffold protein [Caulobacterales bacterium]
MIDDLYSGRVLMLAANIPHLGSLPAPQASIEKTSRLCGSRVKVDLVLDGDRVADFAQEVKACALGQAAAGVLGEGIIGASVAELEAGRDALRTLLAGGEATPPERFSALSDLAPIREYPARHASTLLAFEAVVEAAHTIQAEPRPRVAQG